MTALRAIFSRFGLGDHDRGEPGYTDKRTRPDRRQGERRGNVFPLQDRETRLRFAAKAAGFGTYDLDCLTGDNHWSPELKAIAGLPLDEGPVPLEQVEEIVCPEDREQFISRFQASLDPRQSGEFESEFRLCRPDGEMRWVRAKGRTFFVGQEEERQALGATGIVIDITASRTAEEALIASQAQLSGLIQSMIDAVISIDADQRVVLFNPAACRMFRCSEAEALGQPLDRFLPERFRAAHRDHVRRFAENGLTARAMGEAGEFRGRRLDGEEFPIEASISKVQVQGRRQLTVFVRDITARKAAEEALRRSRQDLELAVHGANLGVWSWDLASQAVSWSERCYELFGLPPGEAVTTERFLATLHPDDREPVAAAVCRAARLGEEFNVEYRVVWPDGSLHWVAIVGRAFAREKAEGEPDGRQAERMSGVAIDITRRKQDEEALQRLNEELEGRIADRTAALLRANEALERSNLELQQFAYIAAHDLQTPLRSISGFAQLLRKDYQGRLDDKADLWLGQLMRAAQRMYELIQDLLAYSRVDSRGNAFRPVAMGQLFDDVVTTLDAAIRESGAQVTCGDLPVVMGDAIQLAQVLQNLIDNGLKYHDGGRAPRVHVSARRRETEWLFSVEDNGIGMAAKHLDHIFEIFYRLHTQQEYPGTGIGLAVCRRVIHRHGGRIWAESEPGKGSVFHFTLPDKTKATP